MNHSNIRNNLTKQLNDIDIIDLAYTNNYKKLYNHVVSNNLDHYGGTRYFSVLEKYQKIIPVVRLLKKKTYELDSNLEIKVDQIMEITEILNKLKDKLVKDLLILQHLLNQAIDIKPKTNLVESTITSNHPKPIVELVSTLIESKADKIIQPTQPNQQIQIQPTQTHFNPIISDPTIDNLYRHIDKLIYGDFIEFL